MRPGQDQPGELTKSGAGLGVPFQAGRRQDATVLPQAAESAAILSPPQAAPAELAGMLLPTEGVTFASSPHPIIFVRPVVHFIVIALALAVVLGWQTHPIVRGHHVTVALVTGTARLAVLVAAALLLLREIGSLVGRLFHFLAYRIVTTNRRVFIVEGLFGRRVRPLGNTALAGATMSQGMLGRMFGYGTVTCAQGTMRDMRDPVRLYREFEAVAMGVEGDTWKQAIRQTQIP
jgi:hypothetical protein